MAFFFFQAEDGIRDGRVTGVQTCALPITYAAQNIRSNVICPGFIDTPMVAEISSSPRLLQAYLDSTPLHRAGKPLDIAYMALYLASDEAAFVTGGVFVVDGGVTAR